MELVKNFVIHVAGNPLYQEELQSVNQIVDEYFCQYIRDLLDIHWLTAIQDGPQDIKILVDSRNKRQTISVDYIFLYQARTQDYKISLHSSVNDVSRQIRQGITFIKSSFSVSGRRDHDYWIKHMVQLKADQSNNGGATNVTMTVDDTSGKQQLYPDMPPQTKLIIYTDADNIAERVVIEVGDITFVGRRVIKDGRDMVNYTRTVAGSYGIDSEIGFRSSDVSIFRPASTWSPSEAQFGIVIDLYLNLPLYKPLV